MLAGSTWSWLLYSEGERRWLAVLCGTVGLYERVIELDASERERLADDPLRLEAFAREIAGDPRAWGARHCAEVLDLPAARAATARWHTRRRG